MYHRFGEDRFPSTSIRIEQFEAHLRELDTGGYNVMALGDIVKALRNGNELPDRAVAITIDDAYLSVYEQAWPRLRELGFPFTLFIATDPVDMGLRGYMSWPQIRELEQGGAAIGSHTASHLHMAADGVEVSRGDLAKSAERFKTELGFRPELFAYPYGETSGEIGELVRSAGFKAALGQHSGAAAGTPDLFYLPRFAVNEAYGDMQRFRLAANALALKVSEVSPDEPLVDGGAGNPPAFGFTVSGDNEMLKSLGRMSCYASHEGRLEVALQAVENGRARIEVNIKKALPDGRTRLNCTLPARDGRWYWFGYQFFKKS